MISNNNIQNLNIILSKTTLDELNVFVKELGIEQNKFIEQALTHYFDILEEKLAFKRLKELEEGKVKSVAASEVWHELGL